MGIGKFLARYFGLCLLVILVSGCQVQLTPVLHTVEYRSGVACAPIPKECPWKRLEAEAAFSARVNCLLAGATVIRSERAALSTGEEGDILVAHPPRYGYERLTEHGDGERCSAGESVCQVVNRADWKVTWASCVVRKPHDTQLRGGRGFSDADRLRDSVVVTGNLAGSTDQFTSPEGLDGPDRFYTFTLRGNSRVEVAVGANTSYWPPRLGHLSPWQPGLYLLAEDGTKLGQGRVWRAGVTYLFPMEMGPGTYYLVVDSSQGERARGDGVYHLYLGLNRNHMGPIDSQ